LTISTGVSHTPFATDDPPTDDDPTELLDWIQDYLNDDMPSDGPEDGDDG